MTATAAALRHALPFTLLGCLAGAQPVHADLDAARAAYERKDYAEAFREFERLASQGDSSAQASLGVLYETGQGVERDYEKALAWYSKSAEQGNDNAQYYLGSMYYTGTGVEKDLVSACTWYAIATRSGHGGARNSMQLCLRYLDDEQRTEYAKRAEHWFAERKR